METIKKSKRTKRNAETQVPPKKKISKFGKMANYYAGKIQEIGNVWDL